MTWDSATHKDMWKRVKFKSMVQGLV